MKLPFCVGPTRLIRLNQSINQTFHERVKKKQTRNSNEDDLEGFMQIRNVIGYRYTKGSVIKS